MGSRADEEEVLDVFAHTIGRNHADCVRIGSNEEPDPRWLFESRFEVERSQETFG